jgi:hypothetical protein
MANIVVAIRSGHERNGWIHPLLNKWLILTMFEQVHNIYFDFIIGVPGLAGSANSASKSFMEFPNFADAEWLCIIDNDTVPPVNMLRMLDDIPDYVDIVGPLCPMQYGHLVFPQQGSYIIETTGEQLYRVVDNKIVAGASISSSRFVPLRDFSHGLHEVDRVGGGCWFIRRRVFDAMEKPYFKVMIDPVTQQTNVSDDCYFQDIARKLGFRLFCDTRYIASHFHTLDCTQYMEGIVMYTHEAVPPETKTDEETSV